MWGTQIRSILVIVIQSFERHVVCSRVEVRIDIAQIKNDFLLAPQERIEDSHVFLIGPVDPVFAWHGG